MVSDNFIEGLLNELKKEVINQKYEEIKFKDKSERRDYTVHAPVDPPFTTAVHFECVEEEKKDETLMLLSTDMEQVNRLFCELRDGDPGVIAAFDWVYTHSKRFKDAAFALCYDFVSNCPIVEVAHKSWMKDEV